MHMRSQSVVVLTLLFLPLLIHGQEIPTNLELSVTDGTIELSWQGSSPFYEVQQSSSLDAFAWLPAVQTSEQSASIPLGDERLFLRVGTIDALPPDLEVTDQRYLEIQDEIYEKILSLEGTDEPGNRELLLEFLSSYDEIIAAGWARDGVSLFAALADGQTLLIVDNQPYDYPGKPGVEASEAEAAPLASKYDPDPLGPLPALQTFQVSPDWDLVDPASNEGVPQGLPVNNKAVLVKAEEQDIHDDIIGDLAAAFFNRNYDTNVRPATVESYLGLAEAGEMAVLIVDSHGGLFPVLRSVQRLPNYTRYNWREEYVVKTTTPVTAENLLSYKSLIDSNQLVKILFGPATSKGIQLTPTEGTPEPPVEVPKGTYAFTSRLVREHFRFAKNSLVYLDTCWSASRDAREFREACFDRGASVYLGWDNSIHYEAAETLNRELFDGLLGLSQLLESPSRQRPFDLDAMMKYLGDKYGLQDPLSGASNPSRNVFSGKLTVFDAPTNRDNGVFKLLSPSIRNMFINEEKEEVQLFGLFDPDQEITISVVGNGTSERSPVPDSVSHKELKFSLPAQTQPSAGWITIIQAGRTSNSVPITQWIMDVNHDRNFTVNVSEPVVKYQYKLYFRGDIHKFRTVPYGDPVRAGSSLYMEGTRQSTGRLLSASGTWTFPNTGDTEKWELAMGPVDLPPAYIDRPQFFMLPRLTISFSGNYSLAMSTRAPDALRTITTIDGVESTNQRDPSGLILSPTQNNGSWNAASYGLSGNNDFVNGVNDANWAAAEAQWAPNTSVPEYAE